MKKKELLKRIERLEYRVSMLGPVHIPTVWTEGPVMDPGPWWLGSTTSSDWVVEENLPKGTTTIYT